jgi:transcriptional regulator with XRE-family HTH domain
MRPQTGLKAHPNLGIIVRHRGLKEAVLARRCDIRPAQLSHVLAGRRALDPNKARRIADRLDLPLELLFTDPEED